MNFVYISFFLCVGLGIYFLGLFGILINLNNILLSIICVEVMFFGLSFYLVVTSLALNDIVGEIMGLFVVTVAAAESAIALGLAMSYFKIYKEILLGEF